MSSSTLKTMDTAADKVVNAINTSYQFLTVTTLVSWIVCWVLPFWFMKRMDTSLLVLFASLTTGLIYFLVLQRQRVTVANNLDKAILAFDAPSVGASLRLIELLFSQVLNRSIKAKVINLIFRGSLTEIALHQETMVRFAKRWLKWVRQKESPLNKLAWELAYRESWLPEDLQERMRAKLVRMDFVPAS